MPAALPSSTPCDGACENAITTLIAGPAGAAGADGAAGTDGVNAFTTLTLPLIMPAASGSVVAAVATNVWIAYGQIVAIGDPAGVAPYAYMLATSKVGTTLVTLTNLEDGAGAYDSNVVAGTVFPVGTIISPGGLQGPPGIVPADALLAANDLGDVNDVPTARTNLGLGTIAVQNAAAVNISGGTVAGIVDLAVADGGTGASAAAGARANLSAAALGANSDITSLSGLTTALSVAQGGTGATTTAGARTSLSAKLGGNTVSTAIAYGVGALDALVLCDATGGAFSVALPAVASNDEREVTIKKIDASGNAVTVDADGAETIDGAPTYSLPAQWDSVTVRCNGTAWFVI